MRRTLLNTSVALAVAGFLGTTGAAIAQQPTTPSAAPPTATTTPSAATGTQMSPSSQAAVPARTESATSAFGKLDMKHRGYVSSDEVSQLQGFNFKSADKNNDGKLDQTEFNAAWATYSGAPK